MLRELAASTDSLAISKITIPFADDPCCEWFNCSMRYVCENLHPAYPREFSPLISDNNRAAGSSFSIMICGVPDSLLLCFILRKGFSISIVKALKIQRRWVAALFGIANSIHAELLSGCLHKATSSILG